VIDASAFKQLAAPTQDEILAILRAGESVTYSMVCNSSRYHMPGTPPKFTFHSEDLRKAKLKEIGLDEIKFDSCRFTGAELEEVTVHDATDCDFTQATGDSSVFGDVTGSRFCKANFKESTFEGDLSRVDFTGATLEEASFCDLNFYQRKSRIHTDVKFAKAKLPSSTFAHLTLTSPDFSDADLSKTQFQSCQIDSGNFRGAKLRDAALVSCKLPGADFTNADLTNANFADADLTGAILAGANLKSTNLRGAKIDGVDFSKAKNFDPKKTASGGVGPALTELDTLCTKAKRIHVAFRVGQPDEEGDPISIDTNGLKYGWGLHLPSHFVSGRTRGGRSQNFSDAVLQAANVAGHLPVRFETLDVSSTKSPTGGKELRDLVLRGISEAFAQALPAAEDLATATKKVRDAAREKGAADRERREKAKVAAAKVKEKEKKQIAKKIEKAVGKVSDVASFLKALELRIEKPKIDKATKMLKASGFKLFNDVTDQHVSGVVKSQTDPDLVYACRVAHDGQYSCCTQNLNVCGGLRGSICKHTLVLIIGLVQAGELDPTTIDGWIAKTHSVKPELDKEIMGEIFIKYKGAEAGEVDWRPTETVPEDYYAL
jgi:uncharacterized protein YjbI with pentapeptide repeats